MIDGVAKKMSDYFFGRFADVVDPILEKDKSELAVGINDIAGINIKNEKKRVQELKSNFLNKYIYSIIVILILLLVVIFYFVSR